ncbi:hypothetical protein [Sandaracinus amylolyticus]|uniref:hypothetical protein n=1 Tax=Sandaracinus amylolyticus TaxID=927083 RepID=UPI001F324746|nr:hypothetical protein [Sandaracinus amylolyticus]UJR81496.1 Hypothetical protein I5071_35560 [Sandaracinus amylolyticus]
MTTSEYEGRVLLPSTRLEGRESLSSHALRLLASNAHHLADQRCNHLVNWVAPKISLASPGQTTVVARIPNPVSTSFVRVAMYGPLPLTPRDEGRSYPLRLELAGAASSAGTAVTFAAVLVPAPTLGTDYVTDSSIIANRGVIFAATTSTTPAWLAAASGSKFFELDPSIVAEGWGARPTLRDTGGEPASVDTCEAWLVIYAKSAGPVTPRVYGVHLSEYVGA